MGIIYGLENIHRNNLIHKNLHLGNILIGNLIVAYLSDLGLCRPANEVAIPYTAPEILCGKPYTMASDIYSLGVIINVIISGELPFNEFNEQQNGESLRLEIFKGLRPTIKDKTPHVLRELIQRCWNENPQNRPTIFEIVKLFISGRVSILIPTIRINPSSELN